MDWLIMMHGRAQGLANYQNWISTSAVCLFAQLVESKVAHTRSRKASVWFDIVRWKNIFSSIQRLKFQISALRDICVQKNRSMRTPAFWLAPYLTARLGRGDLTLGPTWMQNLHCRYNCNKLAKLGDAIAISKSETKNDWPTHPHWLTGVRARRCYPI